VAKKTTGGKRERTEKSGVVDSVQNAPKIKKRKKTEPLTTGRGAGQDRRGVKKKAPGPEGKTQKELKRQIENKPTANSKKILGEKKKKH